MKILWIKSDFLHPTTKGGHIRTLEMLRRLREDHEIHYVAFADPSQEEGIRRSVEYCHRAYPMRRSIPKHGSPAFVWQVAKGIFSPVPVAVSRYRSPEMERLIDGLIERENFDSIVCDFIFPAPNIRALDQSVIFQHNVETMIWRRHAEVAADFARKAYFNKQAARMFALERTACRAARHVIAVSAADAQAMQKMFGLKDVSHVGTGVDLDYFSPPAVRPTGSDLVFVGSMDWLPNIDGVLFFAREILPLIRQVKPECSLTIVGREPNQEILNLARQDRRIQVTGTVPDVRPHLWGAQVSIVPLRIGGGTRLKIYESMAARVPVVSTTVGAEGLAIHPPADIRIADDPAGFAAHCLELLAEAGVRRKVSDAAWQMVSDHFSWEKIAQEFGTILARYARST